MEHRLNFACPPCELDFPHDQSGVRAPGQDGACPVECLLREMDEIVQLWHAASVPGDRRLVEMIELEYDTTLK
jgi:hypothetical protein